MIHQQFKRLRINFDRMPPANAFKFDGVTEMVRDENGVQLEIRENLRQVIETAVTSGITDIDTIPVTLEEIFLAYYGKGSRGNHV